MTTAHLDTGTCCDTSTFHNQGFFVGVYDESKEVIKSIASEIEELFKFKRYSYTPLLGMFNCLKESITGSLICLRLIRRYNYKR